MECHEGLQRNEVEREQKSGTWGRKDGRRGAKEEGEIEAKETGRKEEVVATGEKRKAKVKWGRKKGTRAG